MGNANGSTSDIQSKIRTVIRLLDGKTLGRDSPVFNKTLEWLDYASTQVNDALLLEELVKAATVSFQISREELLRNVAGVTPTTQAPQIVVVDTDSELMQLLPKDGWCAKYAEYTTYTEAPLSFHIFSSLCVLGAALGRRVMLKMGFFDIFPNYCVILIGPTGRVRKTSAADIAKALIRNAAVCPIMSDAITPEALTTALARDGGHQFIYAPEFAVLFNKQKYNEALTTRIIRLLDSPETFEVETQARSKELITNVALTFLGCSTPSLFSGATPEMVTSSGFLNRFILVNEDDTNREYCVPARGTGQLEDYLTGTVRRMKKYEGPMVFSDPAFAMYKQWYHERKQQIRQVTDEVTAEVLERGAGHMLRTAMLLHAADHCDNCICDSCIQTAVKLLAFVEKRTHGIITTIKQTGREQDADRILQTLRRLGGISDHSTLLRRTRLDAPTFKRHISTLKESQLLREEQKGVMKLYILTQEGVSGTRN